MDSIYTLKDFSPIEARILVSYPIWSVPLQGYWQRYEGQREQVAELVGPAAQVRIVYFMLSVTRSMIEAMQAAEASVSKALSPGKENTGTASSQTEHRRRAQTPNEQCQSNYWFLTPCLLCSPCYLIMETRTV